MLRQNTFELPFKLVPSYNVILRMNHWERTQLKEEVYGEMLAQYNGKHRMKKCTIKFSGHLCKYRDWDGFFTGLKYILDFLVNKGFIPDDSPEYVSLETPEQHKVKTRKEEKFIIIMTEVE